MEWLSLSPRLAIVYTALQPRCSFSSLSSCGMRAPAERPLVYQRKKAVRLLPGEGEEGNDDRVGMCLTSSGLSLSEGFYKRGLHLETQVDEGSEAAEDWELKEKMLLVACLTSEGIIHSQN